MKIAVYSDLHLEFGVFIPPKGLAADVIILAGDILAPGNRVRRWASRPSVFGDLPVIHVPGNHEFYGTELQGQQVAMQRLGGQGGYHCLQSGSVVIDGVRFLGATLWTDFELFGGAEPTGFEQPSHAAEVAMAAAASQMNDYRAIRWRDPTAHLSVNPSGWRSKPRRLQPQDTRKLHWEQRRWLAAALEVPFQGPTVVITHHAPHAGSLAPELGQDDLSPSYVSQLPASMFEVPVLWVHGHTHHRFDYRVGGCRVVCNPRGYTLRNRGRSGSFPEVEDFDPHGLIDTGELAFEDARPQARKPPPALTGRNELE
jgi:hypothetical protein